MARDGEPDLRLVDIDELYGELRRRRVSRKDLDREVGLSPQPTKNARAIESAMRSYALGALVLLTLGILIVIGYLAIEAKEIPDLLSGLAGSGFGGIIGILTGRPDSKQTTRAGEGGEASD